MTDDDLVMAAGGVVLREGATGTEVLVVHRPAYDDWSLPKGKLDNDEGWAEAAVREVEEETGVRARLVHELATSHYRIESGRPKRVRWWAMEVVEVTDHEPSGEVDRIAWWPVDRARSSLDHANERAVLEEALAATTSRIILVVRHAHAGNRERWDGDDALRPLTDKGHAQAGAIADLLEPWHVTSVRTSPAVRCRETAVPLARARGLEPIDEPRLAEGTPVDRTMSLVADLPTGTVLCSHGDVIANVITSLSSSPALADVSLEWPKASTWVLTFAGADLRQARLLPRPSVP